MGMNLTFVLVMIPVVLFMFMLPIALLVALQVWLCKKSVKLGLILPGISLTISLILVFSLAVFGSLTVTAGNTPVTYVEGGAYLEVPAQEGTPFEHPAQENATQQKTEFHPEALVAAGVVFLVTNIPTVVFGGIWLHYKGRKETIDDLKRMKIEDLE